MADRETFRMILDAVHEHQAAMAAVMPTELEAALVAVAAHHRLTEIGWRPAMYCPRNAEPHLFIEPGSSGIHEGYRDSEGRFWLYGRGDLWPSHPMLFKARPSGAGDAAGEGK